MIDKGVQPGDSFKIATDGSKLTLKVAQNLVCSLFIKTHIFKVGRPDSKGKRSDFSKITLDVFEKLQLNLDLSTRASNKLIATINKGCGERKDNF